MLLFDLSGIVVHTCVNLHHESREEVTVDVVRHVALSSLLYYKKRFSKVYGNPVVCVDEKPYWRESIFPHYKKNRKKTRDESKIDWEAFSANFKEVKRDIEEFTPYPFINVPRAEGDDGIAVLTQYAHARRDPVMIVSSDKDMIQLQNKYKGVKQYSPNRKKLLTPDDADYDLLTHVIKGDVSDGIPNIFSRDDILVNPNGERQRSVTQKMLRGANECADPMTEWDILDKKSRYRFKRNRILIDASEIPQRVKDRIVSKYEHEISQNKTNKMMACVRKYRLRHLMQSVQDF